MSFDPSCIDAQHFLECLEIANITQPTVDELRFSCPFPGHSNGDETASAYMNIETTKWFCHGCKERGDARSFAAAVLSISPLEATRLLRQRYAPGYIDPSTRDVVSELQKILEKKDDGFTPQPEIPEETLGRFAVDWRAAYDAWQNGRGFSACDYMFERGFEPETLDEWEFGYDLCWDRVTFAVRDENGKLIGFKGRAYDDRQPKYLVLGDRPNRPARYGWPCYHTGRVVFGAHRIRRADEIILCEGELNAIALGQKVGRQAVAINGSHFSDYHERVVTKITDSVVLFLDSDSAGMAATNDITDRLSPFLRVSVVPPHEGDPASMTAAEIESCLSSAQPSILSRALLRSLQDGI